MIKVNGWQPVCRAFGHSKFFFMAFGIAANNKIFVNIGTVSNITTVFADIPDMEEIMPAFSRAKFKIRLSINDPLGGNTKINLVLPTFASCWVQNIVYAENPGIITILTANTGNTSMGTPAGPGPGALFADIDGFITNDGAGGTIKTQFAQLGADPANPVSVDQLTCWMQLIYF